MIDRPDPNQFTKAILDAVDRGIITAEDSAVWRLRDECMGPDVQERQPVLPGEESIESSR